MASLEAVIIKLNDGMQENVSAVNTLSKDLVTLNLEGFTSLENVLGDIKGLLAGFVRIEAERFEAEKEKLLEDQIPETPAASIQSASMGSLFDESLLGKTLSKIIPGDFSKFGGIAQLFTAAGAAGLATTILNGVAGLAMTAIPIILAAAGAYILRRGDNFDLENQFDRTVFGAASGTGIGAAIGFFLGGPIGSLVGALLGAAGGALIGYLIPDSFVKDVKEELNILTEGFGRLFSGIADLIRDASDWVLDAPTKLKEALGIYTKDEANAVRAKRQAMSDMRSLDRGAREDERQAKVARNRAERAEDPETKKYYLDQAATLDESAKQKRAQVDQLKTSIQKYSETIRTESAKSAADIKANDFAFDIETQSFDSFTVPDQGVDSSSPAPIVDPNLDLMDLDPQASVISPVTRDLTTQTAAIKSDSVVVMQNQGPIAAAASPVVVDASSVNSSVSSQSFAVKGQSALDNLSPGWNVRARSAYS